MPNQVIDLNVAGSGAGAAADTSLMASKKTVTATGAVAGVLEVQVDGGAGAFITILSITRPGKYEIDYPCAQVRTFNTGTGISDIDIAAEETQVRSASMNVPGGDGNGANLDSSLMGEDKAIVVGGTLTAGLLTVEASEDAGTTWIELATFTAPGVQTVTGVFSLMRVRKHGSATGTQTVGVSAVDDEEAVLDTPVAVTLGAAATTFEAISDVMVITGDGGGNTLATITGGYPGQKLTLLFVDALVSITDTDAHTANTVDLSNGPLISADDMILQLLFDGTSWYEIARNMPTAPQALTLGAGVTTFAVAADAMVITGDGGGNTIATITGGRLGQFLLLEFVDTDVTITDTDAHTANTVDLSAAFTSADDTILLLWFDGTSWYEVSRSANS